MRKIIICLLFIFLLSSCTNDFGLDDEINILVGDEYSFNIPSTAKVESTSEKIRINGHTIEALNVGKSLITIYDGLSKKEVVVNATLPDISISSDNIFVGDEVCILAHNVPLNKLRIVEEDTSILEIDNLNIKGKEEGVAYINVFVNNARVTKKITVNKKEFINISCEEKMTIGKRYDFLIDTNIDGEEEIIFDEEMFSYQNGKIKALKEGTAVITVKIGDKEENKNIEIIKDNKPPQIVFNEGANKDIVLKYGKKFNPFEGIMIIDEIDGYLDRFAIIETNVDNTKIGDYYVNIKAVDSSCNEVELKRGVKVVWDYNITFIGHAGSYFGLMNSEEAIMFAINNLKYQAIEVDIKQTKDGVFVLSHDDTFGGISISSTLWSELKDIEVTSSRNAGYPSKNGMVVKKEYKTKLLTLDKFLDICKDNNVKAVIELKSSYGITNSSSDRMNALMEIIENKKMINDVILLTSSYNLLIWTRNNGYENVECQYLVNSFESDVVLQRCIDYNLDISINVTGDYSNNDEWLRKYKDANIKVSTFTFTQYVNYDVVQKWIDKGVDYVTCDWHQMDKLNLK